MIKCDARGRFWPADRPSRSRTQIINWNNDKILNNDKNNDNDQNNDNAKADKDDRMNSRLIIYCPMSEEARAKQAGAEQVNEWAVRANEQTDERVAQYLSLYS